MIDRAVGEHSISDLRPETSAGIRTLGCDQGKICWVSIVDWTLGRNAEFDIQASARGKLLWYGSFLEDDFGYLDELMREFQVHAAVVDLDPQVNEVREFCRRFPGCAWGCRYRRGQTAKEMTVSDEDTGAPLATVDRTAWISCALGRLKTNPPRLILPRDLNTDYRNHLKSLCRSYTKDKTGNSVAEYLTTGSTQDHYSHSLVYATIGLSLLMDSGVLNENSNTGKVI